MPIGENIEIIIKRTLFEAVGHGRNAAAVLEWAPAVLIVTWLGLKLYGRLDVASFEVVVLVLLLVSGLALRPWWWSRGTCSNTVNAAI